MSSRAKSFALVVALVVALCILSAPPSYAQSCAGSCGDELATNPKATEKYGKKVAAKLRKCAKKGAPTCPTPCAVPGEAEFGLSASCGDLVRCELGELMGHSLDPLLWDTTNRCSNAAAAGCDLKQVVAAGKLFVKTLTFIRKAKFSKIPLKRTKCSTRLDAHRLCEADSEKGAVCETANAVAYTIWETRMDACSGLAITDEELDNVMRNAITQLAGRGVSVTPESWNNADEMLALITEVTLGLDCAAAARQSIDTDDRSMQAPRTHDVRYCGPNKCDFGHGRLCWLPGPGACLNNVCRTHDQCYPADDDILCPMPRSCSFSGRVQACDRDFFDGCANCFFNGFCDTTCRIVCGLARQIKIDNQNNFLCSTPPVCDDGFDCTLDSCSSTGCRHNGQAGGCCGNSICDSTVEGCETCPEDCGLCPCGDGTCDLGEDCESCPDDCGPGNPTGCPQDFTCTRPNGTDPLCCEPLPGILTWTQWCDFDTCCTCHGCRDRPFDCGCVHLSEASEPCPSLCTPGSCLETLFCPGSPTCWKGTSCQPESLGGCLDMTQFCCDPTIPPGLEGACRG